MRVITALRHWLDARRGERATGARRPTSDERAARKYWDEQVAADRKRRGADDRHP